MEKTFVLALIGAHFMMAIGLPEISMDKATSKFDWHRQRDSSDSSTKWRSDLRCGPEFSGAECNPNSINPCCAPSGWCGNTKHHCSCVGCVDYRIKKEKAQFIQVPGTLGCWGTCGNKGGYCPDVCGKHALCCKKGFNDCPLGFSEVSSLTRHACIEMKFPNSAQFIQVPGTLGCWGTCGNKGGYCPDVCGKHALCCKKGSNDCPLEFSEVSSLTRHACIEMKFPNSDTTTTTTTSATTTTAPPAIGTKWRSDLRCGPKYSGAECNNYSDNPCCSPSGWCGVTEHHCSCVDCVDYRIKKEKDIKWRSDLRCGPVYSGAGCNPYSINPCCAPSGWCGMTKQHCSCVGCVDYRIKREKAGSSFRKDPRSSFRKYHPRSSFRKDHLRSIFRKDHSRSTFRKDHPRSTFRKDHPRSTFRKDHPRSTFRKDHPLVL